MNFVEYFGVLTIFVIVWYLSSKTFQRIIVKEFESGLLYRNGKFIKALKAGCYWIIGWTSEITKVDLRIKTETVPGQEVMSEDNIGLKVSLGIKYAIDDPEKAMHLTESFQNDLYQSVQLALRAVVGGQKVEDLLTNRSSMGAEISKSVIPEAEKIGLKVHWVEVKDIMFPGELKKVFAEEIKAKKEGLALLERARGESAALRNLANATKILENNPALLDLRVLQALTGGDKNGNLFITRLPGFKTR